MAGIYVHIPYCHSKCAYCDFYSTPALATAERFARAVAQEWGMRRSECAGPFDTIYLGGGTPSILQPDELATILTALPVGGASEVTIEVNPEDVNKRSVAMWRALGVNRVSMGVQTLSDEQLALIGRRHSAEQAINAYRMLRACGIANVSIDLIYGLPSQTLESWRRTLAAALALRPEHLSAYILSYEPRTRLSAMLKSGKVKQASDGLILEMYACLVQEARNHGYEHYEISNFALPGFRAVHNSHYWDGTPYIGLGPGAHSFDGLTRSINPADVRRYLSSIEGGSAAFEIDEEDDDNRFNDMLITALRTCEGLGMERVPQQRMAQLMRDAKRHIEAGHLRLSGERLLIPEEHWPVADSILTDLVQL